MRILAAKMSTRRAFGITHKSSGRNAHLARQRVAHTGFLTNAIIVQRDVGENGGLAAGAVLDQRSEDTLARRKLVPQNVDPVAEHLDRIGLTLQMEDQARELFQYTWRRTPLNLH